MSSNYMKLFLDCLKINQLKLIIKENNIFKYHKNPCKQVYIDDIQNNLEYHDILDTLKKLNIKYNEPTLVNLNKKCNLYSLQDIKYSYYINNIKINNKLKKKEMYDNLVNILKSIDKFKIYSKEIIIIQKNMRRIKTKKLVNLQGPALFNKKICNNETEFITYDKLSEIPNKYFISYRDSDDKFVYGFDVRNLIKLRNLNNTFLNPYTRSKFPSQFIDNLNIIKTNLDKEQEQQQEQDQDQVNVNSNIDNISLSQRIINVFAEIDNLGYYTDMSWFNMLGINRLKLLYKELEDIWNWRLNLSTDMKNKIIPPNGTPFIHPMNYIRTLTSLRQLRYINIVLINKFITSAVELEDRKLGAIYVLMAITLVNPNAANSLPGFYASVVL